MEILLNGSEGKERIVYDGAGYTLAVKSTRKKKDGTEEEVWRDEGFYGTIPQALEGLHRHKFQSEGYKTLEELKQAQDDFTRHVGDSIKVAMSNVSMAENEGWD